MTTKAIEARALHRAAEVARKYAADCRVAADDLTSKRHIFSAQREINAAYDADKIADAIRALTPMSPLQAALQVPEVRALMKAAERIRLSAWGYEHAFETAFHADVFDTLDVALAAFEDKS